MVAQPNIHASALLIGARGLMILGPSGSGKTALSLALLVHCRNAGLFARLVGDDQVLLEPAGSRLIAHVPETIAGLVEVRGFSPSKVDHEPRMVVDFAVRLVPPENAPRFGVAEPDIMHSVAIACLPLAERSTTENVLAVAAWLDLPPFLPYHAA